METICALSLIHILLSALSYIRFGSLLTGEPRPLAGLGETAAQVLALPGAERDKRLRRPSDAVLLRSIADSPRFAPCRLGFYIDRFAPENEMQFAAITIWLPDGSAFAAFRGTDATLVGWKEDFNMSFSHTVPAQRAAQHYTEKLAAGFLGPLRLGGHSKGGNLAVYAATQCAGAVRPFSYTHLDVYKRQVYTGRAADHRYPCGRAELQPLCGGQSPFRPPKFSVGASVIDFFSHGFPSAV